MDEPQFIFVIGCQRSGTTLVGQVLGAHRACLFIDETDGLYPWLEPQLERGWQPRDERWPELIKTADQKYRPAFRRLDQDGRLHPQITHVVLQAPNITYYLPELEERLPRAAYIFVTRDARDIVVSMNKLSSIPMVENQTRRIKSRPELAARFSNETARLGDASVPLHRKRAIVARVKMSLLDDFLGSSLHTLWIRYEDLVCDPDRTGRTLLDHVGLPDDEQVSNHGSVFVGLGSGLTARTRPIDTAGVASFRDRLDPLVESEVWDECGPLMKRLGYVRDAQPIRPETGLPDSVLTSPLVVTGRGGCGTRLVASLLQSQGVFLGNRVNEFFDSLEWVEIVYEILMAMLQRPLAASLDWRRVLRDNAVRVLEPSPFTNGAWGFKLAEITGVVNEIFSVFPNAKLIHVVRHPVDVCLRRGHITSRADLPIGRAVLEAAYVAMDRDPKQIDRDPKHLHNAYSYAFQVETAIRFGREFLGPTRYLEVPYEHVCQSTASVAASLADFAGLRAASYVISLDIDTSRIRQWSAPDPRVDDVWGICGRVGAMLGYSLPNSGE